MATAFSAQSRHFTESGSSPPSRRREQAGARRDIRLSDHGTIVLLHPVTRAAARWFDSHISEDAQWFAGAVVCEPRYVANIVLGARDAGLVVDR